MRDDLKLKPNTIEGAIDWAIDAHRGQYDKCGMPYILHPMRVMSAFTDHTLQMCAVMHDIVEDSDITFESMRSWGWSEDIIETLDALTHRKGEFYGDYIERVRANPSARLIKLADIRDNLSPDRMKRLDEATQIRLIEKYGSAQALLVDA